MSIKPITLSLLDRIEMKKKHPCGGNAWKITRLGADIGLVCETCQRKILLPRSELYPRIKRLFRAESDTTV